MDGLRSPVRFTEEEYFAYTDGIEGRAEYYDGVIVDLAGGSLEHANIAAQIGAELVMATRGKGCRVYTADVRIATSNSYLHPDAAVICGNPDISDLRPGIARNPILLVEVLSESTADRDRGIKWMHYQTLESLREYVLIEQHIPQVFVLTKSSLGEWVLRTYIGMDAVIHLHSLNIDIPMTGIYHGVEFQETEGELS
ncbi:MAG: Uma2 family endonuclease [Bacteroidia bacterium]